MTETTEVTGAANEGAAAPRTGALSTMRLAELQSLASSMGIDTTKKRKADLVAAIRERRSGKGKPAEKAAKGDAPAKDAPQGSEQAPATADKPAEQPTLPGQGDSDGRQQGDQRGESSEGSGGRQRRERGGRRGRGRRDDNQQDGQSGDAQQGKGGDKQDRRDDNRDNSGGNRENRDNDGNRDNTNRDNGGNQGNNQGGRGRNDDNDEGGGRRRRNRQRGRDRKRGRGRGNDMNDQDMSYNEDDVLVPVAGILDVLDNYAFVRTSGYLPGTNDVYMSMNMVKRHGLRKGDAITGAVKAPKDGDDGNQGGGGGRGNRQKFNALVRLDTVNGMQPDQAKRRVDFSKLTPLYPQERLRLETDSKELTTRVIDLVAPIGKGQRGLIVAPAKAGKTMVMQSLANAITTNNPECYLMVVLVDERPEEVTDMERAVKGEVISSTFDRPASDHTTVAELAIERAKRLVELGQDVVVLLDSITKLGRAYNLAAPASGRILSGGVDSAALYPPKKFFGAARNIENGGSLTILATALVETGSKMDEVIFEEFKGTGNMELRLARELANRRIFPAVDVNASGTRREEILLHPEELKIMWKLRRVLAALDPQQGIELLLDRLRKTPHNLDFLRQVQQTSSIKLDDED